MDEITTTGAEATSAPAVDESTLDTGANLDADAAWNALGSKLAGNSASDTEDAPADDESDTDPAEAADAATSTDEGQVAEESEPPADEDPDDIQPDAVKGKQLFFREAKGRRLMAAAEQMNTIRASIPDATPETLQNYYRSSVAADEMEADFQSGDPARVGKFMDFWFGQDSAPEATQTFAAQFIQRLPHVAPKVAEHFSQQAIGGYVQSLYDRGLKGDDQALALAQNIDFARRGSFYEKSDFRQQDPFAAEKQRFQQERDQWNRERQAEAQRRQQEKIQTIDKGVEATRTQAIEEALKPVEAQFRDRPQWKHLVRDLTETVETAINSNEAWKREFAIARERAINDPSGQAQKALDAKYRQFVTPILQRQRKAVVEAITGNIMQSSAKAHEDGRQTAARREPVAAGAPVQRATHEAKMREAFAKGDADAAWNLVGQRAKEATRKR